MIRGHCKWPFCKWISDNILLDIREKLQISPSTFDGLIIWMVKWYDHIWVPEPVEGIHP